MKFGDNLSALRKSARISQEKLAHKVGVSRQSVSKWETGNAYPEMSNILTLCKVFNCEITDLLNNSISDKSKIIKDSKTINTVQKKVNESLSAHSTTYKSEKFLRTSKIVRFCANIASLGWGLVAIFLIATICTTIATQNYDWMLTTGQTQFSVILRTIGSASFSIICVFLFNDVSRLFGNFINGATPFALGNVRLIRGIAILYLVATAVSVSISSLMGENIWGSLLVALAIYAISYIFEYGYYLLRDTP